jgi:hypothetical protein
MEQYTMSQDVARYLSPGVTYDPLRQPLYDRVVTADPIAAGTVLQFFQTPIGQAGKTLLDTNMRLAGQIPAGHVFECWSPRVVVAPITITDIGLLAVINNASDVYRIIHGGFIDFAIVSSRKLQVPIFFLPAGAGVSGFAALTSIGGAGSNTGNVLAATNGEPNNTAPMTLAPFPVVIPPTQTFTFEMTFPVAIDLFGVVSIWVVLDGILHRPALP